MNDFFVDGNTDGRWKPSVPLERRLGAAGHDELLDRLVDLQRRQPGLHETSQHLHDVGEDLTTTAHQVDLPRRLEDDHPFTAFLMSPWIVPILPPPAPA